MEKTDLRILVVDDEEMILKLLRESLEIQGYQVETAQDGQEALHRLEEQAFHIVLTDLNMPGLNGQTLLDKIKTRWPLLEVIVITGYATMEAAVEALKAGASDFISKPLRLARIQSIINRSYQKVKSIYENQELREANEQLRYLNEMKNKFLSITNHEIRTPLTIIRGYLEILEIEAEDWSEENREILNILKKTTQELGLTVDRMHAFSRLKEAHHKAMQPVDLGNYLRAICQEFDKLFRHRQITFAPEIPDAPLIILARPSGIKLILRELLQNALKFTPDSGRVEVRLLKQNKEVILEIEDNGIGIDYQQQELIFQEFYEVQDSIHHKTSQTEFMGGGMGLGLSLVKEMVRFFGGKIELESEPGNGSCFRIILPLKPEHTEVHNHEGSQVC